MDAHVQYTTFPNLYSTEDCIHQPATLRLEWPQHLSQRALLLAWAALLQAYTGLSDPVFTLDARPIQVDVALGSWTVVEVGSSHDIHYRQTSVALNKPFQAPMFALELHYDPTSGQTILSSASCIPELFLQQIFGQLQHLVVDRVSLDQQQAFSANNSPVLSIVNPQRKILPGPQFLHDLISPSSDGAIAVDFLTRDRDRVQLSYQDLDRLSDRLAARIASALSRHYEDRTDDRIVPILIPQGPELYVAQIATLKSGATFCPLNMDVPAERLAFIVKDVAARLVLTTETYRQRFSDLDLDLDIISSITDDHHLFPAPDPCVLAREHTQQHAESLAYVMYTSGSTGLPKGVGVSHLAVTQSLLAHDEHLPHFQRFLQFAAPTFDVSVFEIFFTFYRGNTLVCCDRETMLNDLTGVMTEMNVDGAELTPSVAGTLLRNWDAVPSLRLLMTIGEMVPRSVIEQFALDQDERRRLLPMYGPTEASIHCTIATTIGSKSKAGIIGLPLITVSAFVIGENPTDDVRILPIGHVGELAVAGQLAQGYINRLEQTRAAFVELPGYGQIYRTGDRARLLPSGDLECLGRIASGQVKIRGQRVELGEIEQVICRVDNVRFAVASIIDGNIIVFCLLDDASLMSSSKNAIQEKCKAWLPSFMRPTDTVLFDRELPRLSSGKINKQELEKLYHRQGSREKSDTDHFANELELCIAEVIRKELGLHIGRSEDLWSKGLDSLRAIRLASRLREKGIEVAVTEILSTDTIARLTELLQKKSRSNALTDSTNSRTDPFENVKDALMSELRMSQHVGIEDIVPCSRLQSAMLSESLVSKHINFNWVKIELAKSVSATDFVKAFCRLAQLNDILRSGFRHFPQHDSEFVRIIWADFNPDQYIQYQGLNLSGECSREEAEGLTLLRPLRLEIAASTDPITVSIHIHHALYDGWSWDLIMADLDSMIAGNEPLGRSQFQKFVQFERSFLSSADAAKAQEYWADHLRDINPVPLPILTNRKGCTETHTFHRASAVDFSRLQAASRHLRISRHSIPSAAFATLLSLYCGTSDVIFGSVSSGRTLSIPGIETIIGPCISTLPIRIDFAHLRTVSDLLLHVHHLHLNFLRYGQLPLRDIKKAARISAPDALFDALFVWQESSESGSNTSSALSVADGMDSLQYGLVLEAEPRGDTMHVKATYNTTSFCAEQVTLFISQFEAVLAFYVQCPNSPWKMVLDHMQPSDMSVANANPSSIDPHQNLFSTIDQLARNDPTRVAIEFVDNYDPVHAAVQVSKLSYGDLNQKSGVISGFLLSSGLAADELVCVFMAKSIQLYISILGVLRAGAAYLVIDPQAPLERTRRILGSARSRYCLTTGLLPDEEVLNRFENVIYVEKIGELVQPRLVEASVIGQNLAYAVFTSGSTGIPKGVLITRRNILSNVDFLSRIYPSVTDGALLQACSPAFDVSVFEILYTWHMGMRLCAASNDILFRDVEQFIRLLRITHLSLTPSVAALIRPAEVPQVQMLVVAGEAVTSKVFRDWAGHGLYQGYGPSETTNICSVNCQVSHSDHINNIGEPLPNTSMFISGGDHFQPLPKGALGEIWIGGDQVGHGYLDSAALTAEKFIEHPEHGILYRSGDFGRMLPSGTILFHGRQDGQVKLRGQRIELGEVEHALLQLQIVSDSVCLLIQGSEQAHSRLVAYWSSTFPLVVDPTSHVKPIFDALQLQLPLYMVPDYLIYVEAIPLTSQGKTDRKALELSFLQIGPVALSKFSRQENPTTKGGFLHGNELKVAQALAEVTGSPLPIITSDISFFALGLDSINCINLSRHLLELGFGQVDVSLILRHASIAKLLKALTAAPVVCSPAQANNSKLHHIFDIRWQEKVTLKYAHRGLIVQKILPCTPLQEAMLSQAETCEDQAYQNHLTFLVHGDLHQLEAAWRACVDAHAILRTAFALSSSSHYPYAQIVLASYICPWYTDNKSVSTDAVEEPFLMPPYSFEIIKQSDVLPSRLVLKIHHALYDGQAVSLLLHDVERAYRHISIDTAIGLEPYLDYMVGVDERDANEFWSTHLESYRPKCLSRPSPAPVSNFDSEEFIHQVSSKVSLQALLGSSKHASITVLSLLQLTWARLLSHYSNDPESCFGNVYSGRNLSIRGVEKIVGPCFNTLPVRTMLGMHDTNRQVAKRLQDHNLAALRFQPFSLRLIQRNQGVGRLFDSLLLLQPEPDKLDSSIWTMIEDRGDMGFPIILEMVPHTETNELVILLHAQPYSLAKDEAVQLLTDFDLLLEHSIRYLDGLALDCTMLGNNKPELFSRSSQSSTADVDHLANKSGTPPDKEWSRMEVHVCTVLRTVSGKEFSGLARSTTIFHLGFDSINAIQIAAELRKGGFRLKGGDILEAATVPGIAALCEQRLVSEPENDEHFQFDNFNRQYLAAVRHQLSIEDEAVEEIRPCTPFQAGVLADFVRSQGECYLNSVHYELDQDIDIGSLKAAWELVSSRNDILRTGFVEIDDPRCPFAMVLYAREQCILPWSEVDGKSDLGHDRPSVDSLHRPPWCLVIRSEGTQKKMQLSMLHALFDARSLGLLLDEVSTAYRGGNLPQVLPIKPFLSQILGKGHAKPAENISNLYSARDMPPTSFPNLHSHHEEDRSFHSVEYSCPRSLVQIQSSCREAGVTLQVAGQCAWARLLSSYTGETANTFGVVLTGILGENHGERVLFPSINTIPVSLVVANQTNDMLLANAASRTAKLMKNPFIPFKAWSGSRGELFDSIFVYQQSIPVTASPPWTLLAEDATTTYTVSLELLANSSNDTLDFRLTFRNHVIPLEQARLLVMQFSALLLDTLGNLDDDASQFIHVDQALLSIAPAKEPVIETEVEYLHQFVEMTTRELPNELALEFATEIVDEKATQMSWTYTELNAISNKIAHMLQQNGATPGDFIGFCFEKCPEASSTMLGILKAGCAYVALDPNAPQARKEFILTDSGCRILCTTQAQADSLTFVHDMTVLLVDKRLEESKLSCDAVVLSRKLVGDDVAYCLYTSGTTGTPKGCLITHTNAVQFVLAFQRLLAGSWNTGSRFLQFASFHFDVSVLEQYWSWSVGICVTSAPRDLLFEDLPGAIRALQITHLDLTPSLACLLKPKECPSLLRGAFITGGEQLRQDIISDWGDQGVVYNGYGPSEVTIGCTMYPRVCRSTKPSNIGPAYDNVEAYVLDPHTKRHVLRGGIGELCVSGPLVGKGYLNRPELTIEKFEFLDHLGVRVYHTGDLVRLLHDGSFCFIGRTDDQVKLRGQRLEIGEINHVIRQTSTNIREAATVVLKHRKVSKDQLVTFIAMCANRADVANDPLRLDPSHSTLTSVVRKACKSALPAYMVPSYIIPVNFMPLSANNKIDHKSLKSLFEAIPVAELQSLSGTGIALQGRDPIAMHKVIQAASRVTGLSETSISSSSGLFELGIDSITVISLSRLLKNAGFAAATASTIMRNPVIADLMAVLLEPIGAVVENEADTKIARQDIATFEKKHRAVIEDVLGLENGHLIEKIAPCTPLQQGMLVRVIQGNDSAYLSRFTFALELNLDLVRLEMAWARLQQENEILRTRFIPTIDGYAQVVLKNTATSGIRFQRSAAGQELDTQSLSQHDFEHWAEHTRRMDHAPWNVSYHHSTGQLLMVLDIFHGLYDGISLSLMLEEVACNYMGISGSVPKPKYHDVLPLGPLLSPASAQNFWVKRLQVTKLLNLPLQHQNEPPMVTCSMRLYNHSGKIQLQSDVTESAIFHACWLMALEKEFGILPTLGIVVSGRALEIDGVENVVGPLFNTIPSHIDVHDLSTMADLVEACHQFNADALPYQHTPLSRIRKWLGYKSTGPLFDSLFVYQKEAKNVSKSRKLWTHISSNSQPDYPLALEVEQKIDGSWACTVTAQGQYLRQEQASALLHTLEETFCDLCRSPFSSLVFKEGGRARSIGAVDAERQPSLELNSKQVENGVVTTQSDFDWDTTSTLMRNEIAKLSASDIFAVTAHTSIFELGLDSIDAIKLSARFREVDVLISVSSILKAGTIAEMAKMIATQTHQPDHTKHTSFDHLVQDLRESLRKQGVAVDHYDKVFPVTPLQESMLANYQQYYNQDVLRVSEGVDMEKLKSSWRASVLTHDILRTRFVEVNDPTCASTYAQLVSTDIDSDFTTINLDSEEELQSLLMRRRDLAGSPGLDQIPWHLTIANVKATNFLVLSMHHAVYDGWSISLLHEDIARCYNGLSYGRPSYEPVLGQILSAISEKSRAFWEVTLTDFHPLSFPVRQYETSANSTINRCEMASAVPLQRVTGFCRAESLTLQSLGLACWTIVLAHHLRSQDVCFGVVLSGRDIENADQMMFPTMNTVPFRMKLNDTNVQVAKDTHELSMAISEHQHFPLRKAMSMVKHAAGQLFDTLFIYQKRPSEEQQLAPLYHSITNLSDPEYPVNIEMELLHDQLVWKAACKSDVLDMQGTQLLLGRIDRVLKSILEAPFEPVLLPCSDGISICGLPPFSGWIEKSSSENASALPEGHVDQAKLLPAEEIIAQVLSEISSIDRTDITRSTSLFHLGLDSISAIKVSSALKKRSIKLTVGEMMRAISVEEMAKACRPFMSLHDRETSDHGSNGVQFFETDQIRDTLQRAGLQDDLVEGVLPCTAGQEFFLGMWRASGGRLFYPEFQYRLPRMPGSRETIDRAWQRLVEGVPMLRTIFLFAAELQTSVLQVVLKSAAGGVKWVTEWEDSSGDVDGLLPHRGQPPVMLLARETQTEVLLLLRIHHALYDGVSLPQMMNAFKSLCGSLSPPPQLTTDFRNHLVYLQSATNKEQQKTFWTSYLNGYKPSLKSERSSFDVERTQIFRPRLIDDLSSIERKLRENGISFQAIFFAAFALVHAKVVSCSDNRFEETAELVVGVYLANRSHDREGLEKLLAPTVNVVPLRLPVQPASALFESARSVQDDLGRIGGIENCTVSLSEIHDWTGVKIDCFVNFLRLPDVKRAPGLRAGDSEIEEVDMQDQLGNGIQTEEAPSPFTGDQPHESGVIYQPSIDIEAAVVDGGLNVGIFAPMNKLDSQKAEELLEGLQALLRSLED